MKRLSLLLLSLLNLLTGCVGIPKGVAPVDNFELDRYLGRWYEIARLDHSFERGLSRVTADYSLREDGGVRVINRGWSAAKGKWQQAEGRAYFVKGPELGYLKVSFFGPFYGAYVIFELDRDYRYALVCGPDRSYLWLLAREPEIDPKLRADLIARVAALGFATERLIMVDHR
jgi:apolipoprotein D and lipocalin family protein